MLGEHNDRFSRTMLKRELPTLWDLLAFALLVGLLTLLGLGAAEMRSPYQVGEQLVIHLDPAYLPNYALRTVIRLLIALGFSLILTFVFGTLAAKNRKAETFIIASVDVLQSIPVLSFLAMLAPLLMGLFPGTLLGPEFAAIVAIITSQAWNMILSFYHSVRTVPAHFRELSDVFMLSPWQRFWRVEVPYATPSLVWNMMISMSASWFFVVASEAITVSNQSITLPGVGSYIALAIEQQDIQAVWYAIVAMFVVIVIYNQLLFRPLHLWSQKFQAHEEGDERTDRPFIATLFLRSRWLQYLAGMLVNGWEAFIQWPTRWSSRHSPRVQRVKLSERLVARFMAVAALRRVVCKIRASIILMRLVNLGYLALVLGSIGGICGFVVKMVAQELTRDEMLKVVLLGAYTGFKVMVLIVLCSLIWVPVGVYIGLRPKLTRWCQPAVQFLAAFPANLIFPVVVYAIVKYQLNGDVWTAPLMVLGTQWYILFNVIAGAEAMPKQLLQAAGSFGLHGWLWWRRLAIPAIFPYFITGAITAAGGAWNASILAESVSWGDLQVQTTGLGAYITQFYESGDFHRVLWGTTVMCFYVLIINHLLWQPLYHYAEERFQID